MKRGFVESQSKNEQRVKNNLMEMKVAGLLDHLLSPLYRNIAHRDDDPDAGSTSGHGSQLQTTQRKIAGPLDLASVNRSSRPRESVSRDGSPWSSCSQADGVKGGR